MYGFYKWVLKHPVLGFIPFFILLIALSFVRNIIYATPPDLGSLITNIICSGLLSLAIVAFSIPDIVNAKAVRRLNERCDPEELNEVMQISLKRRLTKRRRFLFSSNYASTLLDMGLAQEAFDVLYSIKSYKYVSHSSFGMAFYSNMTTACEELGDFTQADEWYALMVKHYNSLPYGYAKSWSTIPMRFAEVSFEYRHGNFDAAMKKLGEVRPLSPIQDIEKAKLTADISLALGQRDYAVSALKYVIAKGNKLYAVQKCREKLFRLEGEAK